MEDEMSSRRHLSLSGFMGVVLIALLLCAISAGAGMAQTPFKIEASSLGDAKLGDTVAIAITKTVGSEEIHGYDFLLGYDSDFMRLINATPGELYNKPGSFEWEYFAYRAGVPPCTLGCPSATVRAVSIADIYDGPHHPLSTYVPDGTALFTLNFEISADSSQACVCSSLRFFWLDCGDNAISFPVGHIEILALSDSISDGDYEISDSLCLLPSYYGAPQTCIDTSAPYPPQRFINFVNGIVGTDDISCFEAIDRGDINLNGVANELADLLTFQNYLYYGESAFTINVDSQRAATDIKADNIPLTVDDFIYLRRVIFGQLTPTLTCPPAAIWSMETFDGVVGLAETDSSIIIRTQFDDSSSALQVVFYAPGRDSADFEYRILDGLDPAKASVYGGLRDDTLRVFVSPSGFNDVDYAIISSGLSDIVEIVVLNGDKPAPISTQASGFWAQHINVAFAALPNLPPSFDVHFDTVVNDCYGGFTYDFDAHDNNFPADDIEYHLISGFGEIDPITGVWTYVPLCLDTGTQLLVEVCASDILNPCPQTDSSYHAYLRLIVDTFPPILGDADNNGGINALDITRIINYLYKGGPEPIPIVDVADVNLTQSVDALDVTFLINYLYKGGAAPTCPPPVPTGYLFDHGECKNIPQKANLDSLEEDCVVYQYDGELRTLNLTHVNAVLNCCPIFVADIQITDSTILIEEFDSLDNGGCDCNCPFDISYRIDNLSPGVYTIKIIEPYLPVGEPPLEFIFDLDETSQGYDCIDRPYLPWPKK
jgi:hypothetical protein